MRGVLALVAIFALASTASCLEISPKLDLPAPEPKTIPTVSIVQSRQGTGGIISAKRHNIHQPATLEIINRVSINTKPKAAKCDAGGCTTSSPQQKSHEDDNTDRLITDIKIALDTPDSTKNTSNSDKNAEEDEDDAEVPVFKGLVGVKQSDISTTPRALKDTPYVPTYRHNSGHPGFQPSYVKPTDFYNTIKPAYYGGGPYRPYPPRNQDHWTTEKPFRPSAPDVFYERTPAGWVPCMCDRRVVRPDSTWRPTARSVVNDKLDPSFSA